MSASVQRVRAALTAAGLDVTLRAFPEGTRTAQDAAAAIGVQVGQIVKSLVFATETGDPVLVLASGANRVDERRVGELLGTAIGRADAALVREATGYAIGGVPPVGHATAMPTLVDEDLLAFDEVWAAAGTPRDVFAIAPADLVRASGGQVATVT
ncbi:YbaK/EbsC family protein [Capillimicrobium parvum]|uniref:Cys-tRNA(Pro)/Cys-tRNA(Cys) deacylase YbaK n=1 Tax=Capillimicrobium parvum TaxID=2884022 RepID=A0A9E6Y3S9_9ACTN|nr:YbaK/EbsC family protein [Capillimicrobium parvum]UGS39260.1 Cys-tRNA(Pro)/Cys-tRNA(Cys) deacylase YbaK [Capillimicrobium parvum]